MLSNTDKSASTCIVSSKCRFSTCQPLIGNFTNLSQFFHCRISCLYLIGTLNIQVQYTCTIYIYIYIIKKELRKLISIFTLVFANSVAPVAILQFYGFFCWNLALTTKVELLCDLAYLCYAQFALFPGFRTGQFTIYLCHC